MLLMGAPGRGRVEPAGGNPSPNGGRTGGAGVGLHDFLPSARRPGEEGGYVQSPAAASLRAMSVKANILLASLSIKIVNPPFPAQSFISNAISFRIGTHCVPCAGNANCCVVTGTLTTPLTLIRVSPAADPFARHDA